MKIDGEHAKQDDLIMTHFNERVAMVVGSHMQMHISLASAFELKGVDSGREVGDHCIRSTGQHEMIRAFEATHGLQAASSGDQNIILRAAQ